MLRKQRHVKKRGIPKPLQGPAFAVVRGIAAAVNIAGVEPSMRATRRIGGVVGAMACRSGKPRFERAMENISWCFPGIGREKCREFLVESYRHLFSMAAEMAWTPRLITEDGFPFRVELGDLADGLSTMLRAGPCVMVTGHTGNWELLGYTMALLGFPVHAVYRPLDFKPMDDWLYQTRSRRGLLLLGKFGVSDELPGIIASGSPVGFIADQNAGDRGLFVPFFNRLASSYKAIALLAVQHNATVVCGQAVRLTSALADREGGGLHDDSSFRYRLDCIDVIRPDEWADQPDPAFYITARYRRAIETMVRRAPEQYLWMHRYWKSRPPHERPDRDYKGFPSKLREKIEQLPWMTQADVEMIVGRSERDAAELRQAANAAEQRASN